MLLILQHLINLIVHNVRELIADEILSRDHNI